MTYPPHQKEISIESFYHARPLRPSLLYRDIHLYYIYSVKTKPTQKTTAITTAVAFATCSYTPGQVVLF